MNPTIPLRIHVEPDVVRTAPGEPFHLTLSVFNTSDIIDGFDITVVGADQNWVVAEPDWISLFPDSEGSVNLTVTLPSDFRAGPHQLGVKVTSRTTNEVFAVGAVDLDITDKVAARLNVDPDAVQAGKRARFSVIVHNDGNVPIDVGIAAKDDGNVLAYDITPSRIELGPGQSRTCQLVVTAPRPITGMPAVRPFVINATGPGVELTSPAVFTSRPWIPRWLLTFLAIALLLGLWAFIIGLALDAILSDVDQDLADAFEQGIAAVVAAVAPGAGAGGDAGDVVTGPAGAVSGVVTAVSDSSPVAGATASAQPLISVGSRAGEIDVERDPVEVAAGDDGAFLYEDMVRGSYQLTVSAPGYTPSAPVPFDVPFEGEPLMVELVGAPGLISGVVLAGGEPLPDASLRVRRLDPATGNAIGADGVITEEPLRSAVTPTTGRFALDELPTPGIYEVDVSSPGFTTMRIILELTAGQRLVGQEIELAGTGAGTLSGTVTDATTGLPLGGVEVVASGEGAQRVSTTLTTAEGAGTYRLTGLPAGDFTATFKLAGYSDLALPFSVSTDVPDVVLSPAMSAGVGAPIGAVEGTVVDADTGAPLGLVEIAVTGTGPSFTATSATQAADGVGVGGFRLTNLPIGSYTASFSLANYAPEAISFTVTPEQRTATLSPRMRPMPTGPDGTPLGQVTGRVTDSVSNQGIGGVTVTISGMGIEMATVTFTGDGGNGAAQPGVSRSLASPATPGSFVLNAIPEGTYTASFTSSLYETVALPFEITADQPSPTLNPALTPRPTTMRGSVSAVETSEGTWTYPVPNATVSRGTEVLATSGGDGSFNFTKVLSPGPITLTVTAPGFSVRNVNVIVTPGTTVEVGDVILTATARLTGSFVDVFGTPLGTGGQATISVTEYIPPGGATYDVSTIPPVTMPMGANFVYDGLPGRGDYTFRVVFTNGNGNGLFRGRFVNEFTFETYMYSNNMDIGGVEVPFGSRVLYGEVYCYISPAPNVPLGLSDNPEGGPAIRQTTSDAQGRYNFGQVPAGTYWVGYRSPDGTVWSSFPSVTVTNNGPVRHDVDSFNFCPQTS